MTLFQCFSRLSFSCALSINIICLRTIITISLAGKRCWFFRKLSRNILFNRFRVTAFWICFLAIANPILGPAPGALPTNIVIAASPTRLLLLKICWYSLARVSLACLGNDSPIWFPTISKHFFYGVRRALPLALRAFITLRPPRVCMRARNPCVLARFKLLGWNVRFMS